MDREYHRWYSTRLGRDMELLRFGHAGRAVLFFPPRMGRFYDYENWGIIGALAYRINNGELQLFCVDSIDEESLYSEWAHPIDRINRHLQYEQYIIAEVLPLMRTKKPDEDFEVAGCSLGAYHAANIALKYPNFFKKLICMSGRFDLTRPINNFRDLFEGFHNTDIYLNMPRQYLANMQAGWLLDNIRQMEILIAIGEADPFKNDNDQLSELLGWMGVNHQLYTWNGYAHNPNSWRKMVALYL
ncbi:esterase family protein [Mucilaginibacter glaciei]|uniref:Esterase family protein n=1 Tax=Mucilaginibacter glaciei TaxID=2772109 RepID=A0A926NPM3_9SPHI|nr:alpha/beta hydrolase-fold protein [Mucilaginibacter glaciei]MBD1393601.1 esterase family protein [Mucilaginibacter glaciei]